MDAAFAHSLNEITDCFTGEKYEFSQTFGTCSLTAFSILKPFKLKWGKFWEIPLYVNKRDDAGHSPGIAHQSKLRLKNES